MLEVPDYDKISELEVELCEQHNLSDDALRCVFDLMHLKEKEGRYLGNIFPEERKPVDANYVIDHLECIIQSAERLTSGNVAHQRPEIIHLASSLIKKLKEDYSKPNS